MSSTPWPLSVRTMPSIALATFSQWPHQRTTQRNRNDRLFIIAQPLCRRGKSIIKTRLTAKITAVSSIVLERANFFFSSRVSWPVQHHLGAICSPSQIPLPFGIGFTWLIHTVNGLSFQWKKKKRDSVWNCLRSREVLDSSGTSLCLPLTFQQEGCPHYREGLGASGGWWGGSESASSTLKQGRDVRKRMGMLVKRTDANHELRKEADIFL